MSTDVVKTERITDILNPSNVCNTKPFMNMFYYIAIYMPGRFRNSHFPRTFLIVFTNGLFSILSIIAFRDGTRTISP